MLTISELKDLESWDLNGEEIARGYCLRRLEGYYPDDRFPKKLRKVTTQEQRYSRTNALFVQSITERSKTITLSFPSGEFLSKEFSSELELSLVRTLDDLSTKRQYLPYIICDAYKLEQRELFSLPQPMLLANKRLLSTQTHIRGIHAPYAYLSPAQSFTSTHKEDQNLQSVNILWKGGAKVWVVIAPRHASTFEACLSDCLQLELPLCSQFVRHESVIVPPSTLRDWGVQHTIFVQEAGDVVRTDYNAYHYVWNTGLNLAEAVNCCHSRWLPTPMYVFCEKTNTSTKNWHSSLKCGSGPHIRRKDLSVGKVSRQLDLLGYVLDKCETSRQRSHGGQHSLFEEVSAQSSLRNLGSSYRRPTVGSPETVDHSEDEASPTTKVATPKPLSVDECDRPESPRETDRDGTSDEDSTSLLGTDAGILTSHQSPRRLPVSARVPSEDSSHGRSGNDSNSAHFTSASSSLSPSPAVSTPRCDLRTSDVKDSDLDNLGRRSSSGVEDVDPGLTSSVPPESPNSSLSIAQVDSIAGSESSSGDIDATSPTVYMITASDYTDEEARAQIDRYIALARHVPSYKNDIGTIERFQPDQGDLSWLNDTGIYDTLQTMAFGHPWVEILFPLRADSGLNLEWAPRLQPYSPAYLFLLPVSFSSHWVLVTFDQRNRQMTIYDKVPRKLRSRLLDLASSRFRSLWSAKTVQVSQYRLSIQALSLTTCRTLRTSLYPNAAYMCSSTLKSFWIPARI